MATQERNVTEFMQSYIYGLESCGYVPSVPEWSNARNSEKYIIMEAKENGVPISTKVVDLTIEARFSETKKRYDADLAKQVKFLKPKLIDSLSSEQKKNFFDQTAVLNKMCGIGSVNEYGRKVEKARSNPLRHKASAKTVTAKKEDSRVKGL